MTPQFRANVERFMAPQLKLVPQLTRLQALFDGDPAKITQYLIYEAHHGDERVNSTIHYGPMRDKDGNVLFTVRKNPAKAKMYGREHVHHFLTFTFKNNHGTTIEKKD